MRIRSRVLVRDEWEFDDLSSFKDREDIDVWNWGKANGMYRCHIAVASNLQMFMVR